MSGRVRIVHGPTENVITGYTASDSVPTSGSPSCFMECLVCGREFRRKQSQMRRRNFCSPRCAASGRTIAGAALIAATNAPEPTQAYYDSLPRDRTGFVTHTDAPIDCPDCGGIVTQVEWEDEGAPDGDEWACLNCVFTWQPDEA